MALLIWSFDKEQWSSTKPGCTAAILLLYCFTVPGPPSRAPTLDPRAEKPGACPFVNPPLYLGWQRCNDDVDCPGIQKCCRNPRHTVAGTGKRCTNPQARYECIYTKFIVFYCWKTNTTTSLTNLNAKFYPQVNVNLPIVRVAIVLMKGRQLKTLLLTT